jgi:YHS domain-containing protein
MIELLQANASWIVFVLFLLLMMRMHGAGMGCGGGHRHGTQEHRPDEDRGVEAGKGSAGVSRTAIAKDPVCGMEVDPTTAAATIEYQGRTYHFCAPGCKDAFEMNPEKFVQPQVAGHRHRMLSGG